MNSVFFKHFWVNSTLVLLSFLILGVTFMGIAYQTLGAEQEGQLLRAAEGFREVAQSNLKEGKPSFSLSFNRELSAMADVTGTHVLVCGADGRVEICSDPPGHRHVGQWIPSSVMEPLLQNGSIAAHTTLGDVLSNREAVMGCLVTDGAGHVVAAVLVSAPPYGEGALITAFYRIFSVVALTVFSLACVSAFVTTRRMTLPLRDMAAAAHRFAQGRFDVRVARWGGREDETGELARAFNAMADALEKSEDLRHGFISNVSHELKTPMTTIAGYIDGLLDGTVPPERSREVLTVVRDEVMRLSRLVRRMMDLSRLDAGELALSAKVFDICEHVRRTLLGFEARIEAKELTVEVLLPDTQVNVYADPDSIIQVMTNLLDNAVKFAEEKGLLSVAVRQKAGRVTVSVKNSGQVIPAEDLPFVFERFYKADRSRSQDKTGLGLGLFLIKSLLGAQGQSISVTSENGLTEFVFTLPPAR